MAKLVAAVLSSLDGYFEDEEGRFGWAAPDEEVHAFVNELELLDERRCDTGPGEEVTWRAWHVGVPFRMTSRIAEYDRPRIFVDQQVRGPFGEWRHEHRFEEADGHTVMRDVVDFRSPLGPLGALVDRLVLRRYMTRVLETRNAVLREAAESSGQH